jgi:uncharacterized delta-60 repeat protein
MRNIFFPLLLLVVSISHAQDGTPDPSFGTFGLVSTSVSGPVSQTRQRIAVLPDGKILQSYTVFNGVNNDFGLVRYNSDGSLDASFGGLGTGWAITDFGADEAATSLAVQDDGKILVVGYKNTAGVNVFAVARYLSNGTPDNSFGTSGKVTTVLGTDDQAFAVLEAGGLIVVAGSSLTGTGYDFGVVRYLSNGTLDNSFDTDGKLTTNFNGFTDQAFAVGVQSGKLVVAGYSFTGSANIFAIARYNLNGSLDNTFDGDGKVTTAIGLDDIAFSMVVQPDNKLVLAGRSNNGSNNDFAVARYNLNGSLDNTFDGDGKVTTSISAGSDIANSVVIQANGSLVVAGVATNGSDNDFAVARYTSSGAPDPVFGGNSTGYALVDFGGNDIGYSIASQGVNLIVGGLTGTSLALVRLINSSTVLPLTITSFEAVKQETSVQLNWKTVAEQNISSYEVERSSDGTSFVSIAHVRATANDGDKVYSFTDQHPDLPLSYYRLRIIDNNQRPAYSKIVAVRFNAAASLQVFPNPVRDQLYVQFNLPAGKVSLQVFDASGRVVRSSDIQSSGNTTSTVVDVKNLQNGVYFIRLNDQTMKFIKE